jgi:ketosteroid isomerase-like protein
VRENLPSISTRRGLQARAIHEYGRILQNIGLRAVAASAALAAIVACAGYQPGAMPNEFTSTIPSRRDELLAATRLVESRSRESGFIEGVAEAFAPAGVFAGAGPDFRRGPDGAREWLSRDTANVRASARWRTLLHDVSDDGRDGYSFGYLDVFRANGDSVLATYHAYWRRSEGGEWKILAMVRSPRPAGEMSAPVNPTLRRHSRAARVDSVEALRDLFRTEIAFSDASVAGFAAAFVAFAAPDAAKATGSQYVFGPKEIGRQFGPPPPGFTGIAWKPDIGTVASSGDLGFTNGPIWRRGASGELIATNRRYFTVWRRQPDGRWRYVID